MGADSAPLRRIRTETDLAAGAAALGRAVPRFAPVLAALGPLRLRRRPEGYATLVHAIVSQQVSVASASAIWARLEAAGLTTPAAIAGAAEADLIAVGLTRAKQRYVRALALSGIDYPALGHMPPEAAIKRLTQQPGIGRWTAEIYAKFALGHADVFAAGDLALQEAARLIFDLPARPSERHLRDMAAEWSPWRAVAARALWDYYQRVKGREGTT